MDWIQVLVLAVVQGLTEFLPISSSAHLVLIPAVADWPDQGLAFDVSVHVGTLAAVVSYFRGDLVTMGRDWRRSLAQGRPVGDSRLVWCVGVGTVPIALVGAILWVADPQALRAPLLIAVATIGFALALWWADRAGGGERDERAVGLRDALIVGLAQALALIPGTSRSGVTITAALAIGLSREGAARFSFLLSIPAIALAGGVKTVEAIAAGDAASLTAMLAGALLAWLSAYLCIGAFLRLVARIGMTPFVVYRLALGAVLLGVYA